MGFLLEPLQLEQRSVIGVCSPLTMVKTSSQNVDATSAPPRTLVWATNPATGKRAPYDAMGAGVGFVLHHPAAAHVASSHELGDRFTGKLEPVDLKMGIKATVYVNHFVTCPDRDKHRRLDG